MSETLFFPCRLCGVRAFTIRGFCSACEPIIHERHRQAMNAMGLLSERFRAETGVEALADWSRFEEWLARDVSEAAQLIKRLTPPEEES